MNLQYGFVVGNNYTDTFYDPKVMYNGRKLALVKDKKPNFSRSKRFSDYDRDARRIGNRVGPGSYESTYLSIRSVRYNTTPLFCRFHNTTDKWYTSPAIRKSLINNS